jgi:hypothetical protein
LELRHFSLPIRSDDLVRLLNDGSSEPTESYGVDVDVAEVLEVASRQIEGNGDKDAAWDGELAPVLHKALKDVPRTILLDMRFWHWLSIAELRDWSMARWAVGTPVEEGGLTSGQVEHFLGRPTMRGFARNATSRLFWGADALYIDDAADDGYGHVKTVFARQDLVTGLFEREFSLYRPVPPVVAVALSSLNQNDRRDRLKRLNFLASTIAIEALDEAGVKALLEL